MSHVYVSSPGRTNFFQTLSSEGCRTSRGRRGFDLHSNCIEQHATNPSVPSGHRLGVSREGKKSTKRLPYTRGGQTTNNRIVQGELRTGRRQWKGSRNHDEWLWILQFDFRPICFQSTYLSHRVRNNVCQRWSKILLHVWPGSAQCYKAAKRQRQRAK